jgi:hypothetical protein
MKQNISGIDVDEIFNDYSVETLLNIVFINGDVGELDMLFRNNKHIRDLVNDRNLKIEDMDYAVSIISRAVRTELVKLAIPDINDFCEMQNITKKIYKKSLLSLLFFKIIGYKYSKLEYSFIKHHLMLTKIASKYILKYLKKCKRILKLNRAISFCIVESDEKITKWFPKPSRYQFAKSIGDKDYSELYETFAKSPYNSGDCKCSLNAVKQGVVKRCSRSLPLSRG